MYVTEHVPDVREHDGALNVPVPLEENVTVPLGIEPVTVAVTVTGESTATEGELKPIDVVEDAFVTVTPAEPELPVWSSSPE